MTFALLALVLCADAGTAARATLLVGGDVIPHSPLKDAVRAQAGKDVEKAELAWAQMLAPLQPMFAAADFTVVNLETPVVAGRRLYAGPWIFSAPPELLRGLKRAGVQAVSFANNHARDQQLEGIGETRSHLADAGVEVMGAAPDEKTAWEPLVVERHGIRIGLFAFTRFLNHFQNRKDSNLPHVPFVPYTGEPRDGGATVAELLERVAAMRKTCDVLVVLPHWGNEYAPAPKDSDRALAAQLLEAGATAVVGSHPHVVQELGWKKVGPEDAVLAFSVGNLLSNQEQSDSVHPARSGFLLALTFERSADAVRVVEAKAVPIWTDNQPAHDGRKVEVMPMGEAIARTLARAESLKGPAAKQAKWRAGALVKEEARLKALAAALERSPAR